MSRVNPAVGGGVNDTKLASTTGYGAAPRNSAWRIAGRDACPRPPNSVPCAAHTHARSPHRWTSPGCRSGRGFSRGKTRRTIFDSFVNRVDRDDISGRGIIDPIDPTQADEALAIALAEGHRNAAAP